MMNMKQMLGESGRTISNKDMGIIDMMNRNTDPVSPPARMPLPDNEPRFETRSPENQMFSIDAQIENLMKSYNMLINAGELERAQNVANEINMLDVQKTQIKSNLVNMAQSFDAQIGSPEFTRSPMGRTISNQDRETISSLLESISE